MQYSELINSYLVAIGTHNLPTSTNPQSPSPAARKWRFQEAGSILTFLRSGRPVQTSRWLVADSPVHLLLQSPSHPNGDTERGTASSYHAVYHGITPP